MIIGKLRIMLVKNYPMQNQTFQNTLLFSVNRLDRPPNENESSKLPANPSKQKTVRKFLNVYF